MKKVIIIAGLLTLVSACAILQTVTNISRLKFKIDSVNSFYVSNIEIKEKSKLSDFKAMEILKLTSSLASGKLPVSFNLNVAASNPNDGKGGYPATGITLKSFPWDLYINDKKTISGNIEEPVFVPGVGEDQVIKLKVEMDLLDFINNKGLEETIGLVLKLGGKQGSASNIKLIASPILDTPIGDLKYPDPITIVDYTYN